MRLIVTPNADADIEEIGDRIAERSPVRALSYVQELRLRCSRILDFPHAGPPRLQWGEGIRIVIHGHYIIIYRVRGEAVQILRIVHGARDLDALFEEEPLPE